MAHSGFVPQKYLTNTCNGWWHSSDMLSTHSSKLCEMSDSFPFQTCRDWPILSLLPIDAKPYLKLNSVGAVLNLGGALNCAPNSVSQSEAYRCVPVEIIHATKSSDGVADNIYHCWLLHSKIGEIQIILMFQQNIFLIAFHLLRFHVIY